MRGRVCLTNMIVLFTSLLTVVALATKDLSQYCYDGCSGHGTCVNNICECEHGWYGENCATRFGLVPLTIGNVNVTSLTVLNQVSFQHEAVLFGLSSAGCAKCGLVEEDYAKTNFSKVIFARIDAVKQAELLPILGVDPSLPLPVLVFSWNKGKNRAPYRGPHTAEALSNFCDWKGEAKGWREWKDASAPPRVEGAHQIVAAIVVGFFPITGRGEIDKDVEEWDEFVAMASRLRHRHDIFVFAHPTDNALKPRPAWYPLKNTPLPALGVFPGLSEQEQWKFVTLTEQPPYLASRQTRPSFAEWAITMSVANALPLAFESFAAMEDLGLPMLILFSSDPSYLKPVLPSFRAAAKEFQGKITFLYDEKAEFRDRMPVLGLQSDLPGLAMALNTKDSAPLAYEDEVTARSFREFCIDYLTGRKVPRSRNEAQRVKTSSVPEPDDEEPDIPGVQESFKPTDIGIVDVSDKWASIVLDESADVVVYIYRSRGCLPCKQLAPYYKRIAKRMAELKRSTTKHHVIITRLDLDKFHPQEIGSDVAVPSIIMVPAFNKQPPFRFFSAIAKVFTVMEWIRTNAGRPFEWGEELPQFDSNEKKLFREQIQERESAREGKAMDEQVQQQEL